MAFDDLTINGEKNKITTKIKELKLDYEVLYNVVVHSTESTEINTNEYMTRQMTKLPGENFNTK